MELRLPQEVIKYLDSVRGDQSRQAYIVRLLVSKAQPKVLPTKK